MPTKKELAAKINKVLGVDWNWNKALTKDQLTELLTILSDYGKLAISSGKEMLKEEVGGRAKGLVSEIIDEIDEKDLPIGDKKSKLGDGSLIRNAAKRIIKKRIFGDED